MGFDIIRYKIMNKIRSNVKQMMDIDTSTLTQMVSNAYTSLLDGSDKEDTRSRDYFPSDKRLQVSAAFNILVGREGLAYALPLTGRRLPRTIKEKIAAHLYKEFPALDK